MPKMIHYDLACECGDKTRAGAEEGSPLLPVGFECEQCSGNGGTVITYEVVATKKRTRVGFTEVK